jgi:hypothetical protein
MTLFAENLGGFRREAGASPLHTNTKTIKKPEPHARRTS